MIKLTLSSELVDQVQNDLALALAFEDERPLQGVAGMVDWRLNGKLSKLIKNHRFEGKHGDALLMPAGGRIPAKELLLLGLGSKRDLTEHKVAELVAFIVDRLQKKKCTSFCLSLSDLTSDMFEWRNTVRRFVSMLSGYNDASYHITLTEPRDFISDAKKRNMDFAYDVDVNYH